MRNCYSIPTNIGSAITVAFALPDLKIYSTNNPLLEKKRVADQINSLVHVESFKRKALFITRGSFARATAAAVSKLPQ